MKAVRGTGAAVDRPQDVQDGPTRGTRGRTVRAEARANRTRGILASAAREPLVHFLLIGLLLFGASEAWRRANDPRTVVVTPEFASSLAAKHALQFGAPPTREELEQLVQAHIEEEVLYREALALGLDSGDEIVRRRLAQKSAFLLEDRQAPPEPTEAELRAFHAAAPDRYAEPARSTFSHLYFSPDRAGEADARARADQALSALRAGAARPDAGDPFPDRYDYAAASVTEAARVFGESEFAQAVARAPVGAWSGPYRSGYGWHLLRVSERTPGGRIAFPAVADQVRDDFLAERQARTNAEAIRSLRARYRIVRRDREAAS